MGTQALERGFQVPLDLLRKRRQYYRSIDLRTAVVRVGNEWRNIRARILLTCQKTAYKSQDVPETKNFKIVRKEVPVNQLGQILASMLRGKLDIDGTKVIFWTTKDQSAPSLSHDDYCSRYSERASKRWGIPFPLDVFKLSNPHGLDHEIENVSLQLRCYKTPYEDIFEAVNEALELQDIHQFRKWDGQNEAIVFIMMPNYLAFQNVRLKGNSLTVSVRFHQSIDVNDVRLNLMARGKKTYKQQKSFVRAKAWKQPPYRVAEKSIRLSGNPDLLLYLFESKKESDGPADELTVQNEEVVNRSMIAHEYFDPNLRTLENWLKGEKDSAGFEMSVAVLLHICGFRVEWTGYNAMAQDPPDILAFSLGSDLVVGECTVDAPDDKKIRRLAKRARELEEKLKIATLPVIFLSFSSDKLGRTLSQIAKDENVKVLAYEHLEQILRRYARREAPTEVTRYIRSLI